MEKRQPPRKTLKCGCQEHGFWGWTDRNLNLHSTTYFFFLFFSYVERYNDFV